MGTPTTGGAVALTPREVAARAGVAYDQSTGQNPGQVYPKAFPQLDVTRYRGVAPLAPGTAGVMVLDFKVGGKPAAHAIAFKVTGDARDPRILLKDSGTGRVESVRPSELSKWEDKMKKDYKTDARPTVREMDVLRGRPTAR